MDKQEREKYIDKLLIFMNAEAEEKGVPIKCLYYLFSEDDEDTKSFMNENDIDYNTFTKIVNVCIAREYVVGRIGQRISLSEEGQSRAVSAYLEESGLADEYAKNGTINIGTLHSTGTGMQIGHNNTQNIENLVHDFVKMIDESDATGEEKNEAKGMLKSLIGHPIFNTAIGAGASKAIEALCG